MKKLFAMSALAASMALVGCGGGDINLNAQNNSTTDNSVGDNSNNTTSGGNSSIVCAEYVKGGTTFSGQSDGTNCIYSETFVNFDNPLTENITLRDIGDGAHIFQGSLFVGENYATLAEATAAGIEEGGDGPSLTIQAGVTVAFQDAKSFVAIMRGSQIFANGTSTAPITFTSEADLLGNVEAEETQTWGGMILNGFAFTNACTYDAGWDQTSSDNPVITAGTECSILQEGTEGETSNHYGGAVANDNSGVMRYVVVKHAGFAIDNDNELNGINFGAIGSGTTLENIEIYANYDDGVEFFGGNVNLTNYVALYVRDDSLDIDQGYYGTIENALVIQGGSTVEADRTGAHCVESDGSASSTKSANITKGYTSKATINNLTCILSAKGPGVAGNGDPSGGINAEEAHHLTMNRSIVTTAYAADALKQDAGAANDIPAANLDFTNYCFQLEDSEDLQNAGNGLININTSVFACHDISANKDRNGDFTITAGSEYGAITGQAFLEAQDNVVATTLADDGSTTPDTGDFVILNGFYSVDVADMVVDGGAVAFDDATVTTIGAVSAGSDWTADWTYGLHDGKRAKALWFE
ncbi:serine/threonine protein kinase [Spongiibacter sp. KMU-158]|uniref:Serine/threonine protein kinase n=1 Tax=Spongiibacter pelagi TaxID=2760804 RepID=A0A927GVC0_9GAMM|nr:serine/threonine protein kinase [Spongiibacter pelagi]MBD2857913.1 serine/threonine protein kinase [Spongiibacter pelagi]